MIKAIDANMYLYLFVENIAPILSSYPNNQSYVREQGESLFLVFQPIDQLDNST